MTRKAIKIIVEKRPDIFVAYPVGMKGVVVAEGGTYDEVLTEMQSAIEYHIEAAGHNVFETDDMILDVYVTDLEVSV